jgi:hypothetical protein
VLHAVAVPDPTAPPARSPRRPVAGTARLLVLREEVGRLRLRESRRVFDASVHVGELGGARTGFVVAARDLPVMDVQLRCDVVGRLLEDAPEAWQTTWLVRPGTPEPHDVDLQWLAAARAAFAMHGRPLGGCYVVTRTGWRDLVTEEHRTWVRLRL